MICSGEGLAAIPVVRAAATIAISGLTPAAKPTTRTTIPSNGQRLIAARYRAHVILASRCAAGSSQSALWPPYAFSGCRDRARQCLVGDEPATMHDRGQDL